MEAFLSGVMDENAIPDDLLDEDYYTFDREGTYVRFSIVTLFVRVNMKKLGTYVRFSIVILFLRVNMKKMM